VKTGFTNSAGRTLVASATRDGHRLYAVLLNDPTMYSDASALLDWAFANHGWTALIVAADGGASPQPSGTGAP
jgi:D-alanyl-D-alanine carboxypeptidase